MVPEWQHGNSDAGEEFVFVRDRVSHATDNHDLNHLFRRRAWRPDNKNPGRRDRSDAVAGICSQRNFGFGNGARERAHSLSASGESNEHASPQTNFSRGSFRGKRNCLSLQVIGPPSPQSSPHSRGEADHNMEPIEYSHTRFSARMFPESDASTRWSEVSSRSASAREQQRPVGDRHFRSTRSRSARAFLHGEQSRASRDAPATGSVNPRLPQS